MNTDQMHNLDRFQPGSNANPRSIRRADLNFNKFLEGRLDLNGTVFSLSETQIAVSEAGYPDAAKLRALFEEP